MNKSIIKDLKEIYDFNINNINFIDGGWLNQNWKIETDIGDYLVKEFSRKRFNSEKLEILEYAMERQKRLSENGVNCPFPYEYNNKIIRLLEDDTAYMLMDFCEGELRDSKTITIKQMESLGENCGLMHSEFSKLYITNIKNYPLDSNDILDKLNANYNKLIVESEKSKYNEFRELVKMQIDIINDLTIEFIDSIPKGISHEDFTSYNILFDKDGVTGILDFDRNTYSYIYHDIGRAILSFCLNEDKLEIDKIKEFVSGYQKYLPLTMENIMSALKITWCIEVIWWIQEEFFVSDRGKATVFRDEIIWLTNNYFKLDF